MENSVHQSSPAANGGVLPVTRWLAMFIIPFLVAAAILLYVWPNDTDKTFAWTIKPSMTPMMLAAAYMGGIYFFVGVLRARRWEAVKVGFLPVTSFAGLLGIATILHWDRFNHSHISFFAWTFLYFTAPFLVLGVYFFNRSRGDAPGGPQGVVLPPLTRLVIGGFGVVTLLVSMLLFIAPGLMILLWPWSLTPLTARVMSAMFSLPGIVGLGIALEPRWSAARVILQSQSFSILMILVAVVRAWGDFDPAKLSTWLFCAGLGGMLLLIVLLYASMELFARPKA